MVWFWNKNRNTSQPANEPSPPPTPFPEKMKQWMETLTWTVKQNSGKLSAEVYSELRIINDIFEDINEFIVHYPIRAEQEYIIESTLNNYIPSALVIFNQLPVEKQLRQDKADKMLLEQCQHIKQSIVQLKAELQNEVMSNLTTQTHFMEERFKVNV